MFSKRDWGVQRISDLECLGTSTSLRFSVIMMSGCSSRLGFALASSTIGASTNTSLLFRFVVESEGQPESPIRFSFLAVQDSGKGPLRVLGGSWEGLGGQ